MDIYKTLQNGIEAVNAGNLFADQLTAIVEACNLMQYLPQTLDRPYDDWNHLCAAQVIDTTPSALVRYIHIPFTGYTREQTEKLRGYFGGELSRLQDLKRITDYRTKIKRVVNGELFDGMVSVEITA